MLVLTRKIDQEIVIDGPATVMILDISRGRVKIGITAAPEVIILRGELAIDSEPMQIGANMEVSESPSA